MTMLLTSKNITNDLMTDLQDYMFTSKNLIRFTKHMIQTDVKPRASDKNIIKNNKYTNTSTNINTNSSTNINTNTSTNINKNTSTNTSINTKRIKEAIYKPKQKDSLFWCFYILKNGYSNYEMEINNQYFVIEKTEKFKYIEMIRKNKDILKIHKIRPLTELEDDLANKDKISVKTFFALCILENINVLLVDRRKIFELKCVDIDESHPVNIIHRNSKTYEHHIELNASEEILNKYRDTYYKMSNFDSTIKAIGSYKIDELLDLCKKLDINISINEEGKKKKTKKDIYEILVLNY